MENVIFDEIFIKEIDGRNLSLFSSENLFYLKTDSRFSRIMKKIENGKKEKILDIEELKKEFFTLMDEDVTMFDDRREDLFLSYLKDLLINEII